MRSAGPLSVWLMNCRVDSVFRWPATTPGNQRTTGRRPEPILWLEDADALSLRPRWPWESICPRLMFLCGTRPSLVSEDYLLKNCCKFSGELGVAIVLASES
jgi:hypothetical protein